MRPIVREEWKEDKTEHKQKRGKHTILDTTIVTSRRYYLLDCGHEMRANLTAISKDQKRACCHHCARESWLEKMEQPK